jgi:conjugative transposon TraM protein
MKHTEKFLKQRKFMLMLPVLALPFITLLFWALGGGKGSEVQAMPVSEGLNAKLPDAQFEEEREEDFWDKFSLYERAARDSAEYETARENDPYFDLTAIDSKQGSSSEDESKLIGTFKKKDRLIDPNEAKVNSKLQELYQEINRASNPVVESQHGASGSEQQTQSADPEITALESMMEDLHSGEDDADPEMKEINSMLEKLMDVQHPERVKERMKASKEIAPTKSHTVKAVDRNPISSTFLSDKVSSDSAADSAVSNNGFFEDQNDNVVQQLKANTIMAMVHETQTLVTGASLRLRLLNDVTINGIRVPKDTFIYGMCSINGERVLVEIAWITSEHNLIPVSLSVFDLIGLEGIYVKGAMSRDAAKQATDDAVQGVQLSSLDQSLEVQAATAGIEATKGLISKKTKVIKVTVKAGHQVYLKNKDTQ